MGKWEVDCLTSLIVEETTEGLYRCEATFGNWGTHGDGALLGAHAEAEPLPAARRPRQRPDEPEGDGEREDEPNAEPKGRRGEQDGE